MPNRPNPDDPLIQLLRVAGFDVDENPPDVALLRDAHAYQRLVGENPLEAVVQMLRLRRQAADAGRECANAAEAAQKLEKLLADLLEVSPCLCHLERLSRNGGPPRAICRVSGDLRKISIHPEVPVAELEELQPWEYVCIANNSNKELVVVGTYSHPDLRDSSMGPVVEFKGYHDAGRGLARVARHGDDEFIVQLAPELREVTLSPPAKLVLLRDDHRWAIASVPVDRPESRFEVSLDRIHTRLEDLAGMDPILEPLVKDVVLRMVRSDLQEKFDLRPLNGILIYSYQPGTGKTSLIRGLTRWLDELGKERGFEVALYVVPPNALKNKYHGEDARLVREDLCGSLRARQAVPRDKPLFQLVVVDEIDSLGRRAGGDEVTGYYSPAQNDAVQALLAEMDGMIQQAPCGENAPAHVLWVGLTNRPELLDEALKRGGRFADLVLEVPANTIEGAEGILAVYARHESLPWYIEEDVRSGLGIDEIRRRFLCPALRAVFDAVVLRYATDANRSVDVTAGEIMAGVHYKDALNAAKKKAATRQLLGTGVPAVAFDDVVEGLLEQATSVARSMEADRLMLARQLRLKVPVNRVELVPEAELSTRQFVRVETT